MDTPPDTVAVCYALPSSANVDEPSSTVLDRCDIAQQAPELGFAACHAVLETYELLEMILIHVGTTPPGGTKTLLFCQKVNEKFKSVIHSSDVLQQALFFKLAPPGNGRRFGVNGANPLFETDCAMYRFFTSPLPRTPPPRLFNSRLPHTPCPSASPFLPLLYVLFDMAADMAGRSSAARMYPSHIHFPLPVIRSNGSREIGRFTMAQISNQLTELTYKAYWDLHLPRVRLYEMFEICMILALGPLRWGVPSKELLLRGGDDGPRIHLSQRPVWIWGGYAARVIAMLELADYGRMTIVSDSQYGYDMH